MSANSSSKYFVQLFTTIDKVHAFMYPLLRIFRKKKRMPKIKGK